MKQRVTRIAVLKSSVSIGIVGYILGFPMLVLMQVFANFGSRVNQTPMTTMGIDHLIAIPLFTAFIFFVFSLLGAGIYNLIARFGISIEFNSSEIKNG